MPCNQPNQMVSCLMFRKYALHVIIRTKKKKSHAFTILRRQNQIDECGKKKLMFYLIPHVMNWGYTHTNVGVVFSPYLNSIFLSFSLTTAIKVFIFFIRIQNRNFFEFFFHLHMIQTNSRMDKISNLN